MGDKWSLVREAVAEAAAMGAGRGIMAELLADRDALAAENARLREALLRKDDGEPICPFDGPTSIKHDEPCPVCGDLGSTPLDKGRCVHNPLRLAAPKDAP